MCTKTSNACAVGKIHGHLTRRRTPLGGVAVDRPGKFRADGSRADDVCGAGGRLVFVRTYDRRLAGGTDQDLAAAQQRRLDAQRALESAEIKQATGAADDPVVMAAEERANAARDAANAADIKAADDFKDPWAEKSANQAAADEARAQSHAADAARDDAVNAAQQKLDADAQPAQAADKQADTDVTAAPLPSSGSSRKCGA
jgi:hypothetical protein